MIRWSTISPIRLAAVLAAIFAVTWVVSQLEAAPPQQDYHSSEDFDTLAAARNNDPYGIWSNDTTMFVSDRTDHKIYAYRMSDKTRDSSKDFNTLAAAGNNDPQGIWSNGTTMFVSDRADDKIYAYGSTDPPTPTPSPTPSPTPTPTPTPTPAPPEPLLFEAPIEDVDYTIVGSGANATGVSILYGCRYLPECWNDPSARSSVAFRAGTYDVVLDLAEVRYSGDVGDTVYLVIRYGSPMAGSFSLRYSNLRATWLSGRSMAHTASEVTVDLGDEDVQTVRIPFSVRPSDFRNATGSWQVRARLTYTVNPNAYAQIIGMAFEVECNGCRLTNPPSTSTPIPKPMGEIPGIAYQGGTSGLSEFQLRQADPDAGSEIPLVGPILEPSVESSGFPFEALAAVVIAGMTIAAFAGILKWTRNIVFAVGGLLIGLAFAGLPIIDVIPPITLLIVAVAGVAVCLAANTGNT